MLNSKQILLCLILAYCCWCDIHHPGASAIHPEGTKLVEPVVLIKSGIVTNADGSVVADVLVQGRKIVQVGANLQAPANAKIIDATGKYVVPGGIDPHTHMEIPFMGTVSADDFWHGTVAALAGGTTMIIDFAIPGANQTHVQGYEEWRKKADPKVCSDYGLHMAVTSWSDQVAKDMETLVKEKGVNSFKFFMAYKGALMVNDEEMYEGFKKAASLNAIPMAHCENGDLVVQGQKRMKELGITGPEGHHLSRPANVEAEAVHRASVIAERANAPLYVVHVMSKDAMEEVLRAKMRGVRIIGEPLVHGLILDDSYTHHVNEEIAMRYVMSPPLRPAEEGHREALRNALRSQVLDLVGTDHCAFTSAQKNVGKGDFTKIPNGLHGVEDRMNLLWDSMVRSGELTPSDFVRVTSTQAAKIFNIYPRKGVIAAGSDADIAILDPQATKVISAKKHHHNIDYNIYEGRQITGIVVTTISGGRVVYENGQMNCVKGAGQFVPTPAGGKLFEGFAEQVKRKTPVGVKRA